MMARVHPRFDLQGLPPGQDQPKNWPGFSPGLVSPLAKGFSPCGKKGFNPCPEFSLGSPVAAKAPVERVPQGLVQAHVGPRPRWSSATRRCPDRVSKKGRGRVRASGRRLPRKSRWRRLAGGESRSQKGRPKGRPNLSPRKGSAPLVAQRSTPRSPPPRPPPGSTPWPPPGAGGQSRSPKKQGHAVRGDRQAVVDILEVRAQKSEGRGRPRPRRSS